MAPPVNDNFASSTSISGATGTIAGTVVDATREGTEGTTLGSASIQSVWYTFTAPSTGLFKFWLPWSGVTYVGSGGLTIANMAVVPDGLISTMTATNALSYGQKQGTTGGDLSLLVSLTSGSLYKIKVWADGISNTNVFTYTLEWSDITTIDPANNHFADRIDVGAIPVVESIVSPYDASTETSEVIANNLSYPQEQSVWYSFTPSSTGYHQIEVDVGTLNYTGAYLGTLPTDARTSIRIGTGTVSTLSNLATMHVDSTTTVAKAILNLTNGTEYLIRVSSPYFAKGFSSSPITYNDRTWEFDLLIDSAPATPANDDFANIETISGASGSVAGTTLMATNEAGEPDLSLAQESVWYTYTAPSTGLYNFRFEDVTHVGTSGLGQIQFQAYRPARTAVTQMNTSDDWGGIQTTSAGVIEGGIADDQINISLEAGEEITLVVWSSPTPNAWGRSCEFNLVWEKWTGPANDDFANAVDVSAYPFSDTGYTTFKASKEDDETIYLGTTWTQGVWFKIVPDVDGVYRAVASNAVWNGAGYAASSSFQPAYTLFEGTTLLGLTEVLTDEIASNDPEWPMRYPLLAGNTYYIRVWGGDDEFVGGNFVTFDFDFDLDAPFDSPLPAAPANDDLANRIDLGNIGASGLPTVTGTTKGATTEVWEFASFVPSVWYEFTSTTDDTLRWNLQKTGSDPDWVPYGEIYRIINDPPVDWDDLEWVDLWAEPINGVDSPLSTGTIPLVNGEKYVIIVYNWDFNSSWDDFSFEFVETTIPPNDDVGDAISIPGYGSGGSSTGGGGGIITVVNPDATDNGGEDPDPGTWYIWRPQITQPGFYEDIVFTFISDTGDHDIRVYSEMAGIDDPGDFIGGFQSFDDPGDTATLNNLGAGEVYYIFVTASTGEAVFSIGPIPYNNTPDLAVGLGQPSDWSPGWLVGATVDEDEPDHGAGGPAVRSVWYIHNGTHWGDFTLNITRTWGELTEDPYIAVYKSTFGSDEYADMTFVASAQGSVSYNFPFADRINGHQYYVVVYTDDIDEQGGFIIQSVPDDKPANDEWENATTLSPGTGSFMDVPANQAVAELGLAPFLSDSYGGAPDVWYKFTPASDGSFGWEITDGATEPFPSSGFCARSWLYRKDGPTKYDMVCIAQNNDAQDVMSVPVYADQEYYLMVMGEDGRRFYNLEYELNTETTLVVNLGDFTCSSAGDFETATLFSSTDLRRYDRITCQFRFRYGSGTGMTPGAGTIALIRLYATDATLIDNVNLGNTNQSTEMPGCITIPGGGIDDLSEGFMPTQPNDSDWITVEYIWGGNTTWKGSTVSPNKKVMVNGDYLHAVSTGTSNQLKAPGELQIGWVADVGGGNSPVLEFEDVIITASNDNESLPDYGDFDSPATRVFYATGHLAHDIDSSWISDPQHSVPSTNYVSDPTSSGKGNVSPNTSLNSASLLSSTWFSEIEPINRASYGWQCYMTTLNDTGVLFSAGFDTTASGSASSSLVLDLDATGAMFMKTPSGRRVAAHRQLVTGQWVHFEVEIVSCNPRLDVRWWINGEEQTRIVDEYYNGFGFNTIGGMGASIDTRSGDGTPSTNRGYLALPSLAWKGPLGPIEAQSSVPNSSGTHFIGSSVDYTSGNDGSTLLWSTDDGVTYTMFSSDSESIHGYIDEWPPNDSSTSDFVGISNRDSYCEWGWEDVSTGDTILIVNAHCATRPMQTMDSGIFDTFPDLDPNGRSNGEGAMSPEFHCVLNAGGTPEARAIRRKSDSVPNNTFGAKMLEIPMPRAPNGELWTDSLFNSMKSRFGYQHFVIHEEQGGNALLAGICEIITQGDYDDFDDLPVQTPYDPELWFASPFEDIWSSSAPDVPSISACTAPHPNDLRTDPNMANKVWFVLDFEKESSDWELYYRITTGTPMFSDNPGWDGEWYSPDYSGIHPDVRTIWRWTHGNFWELVPNNPEQFEVKWAGMNLFYSNHFFEFSGQLPSDAFIFNPCGTSPITVEFKLIDQYGVESDIVTRTLEFDPGACCSHPINLSGINIRMFEDPELDAEL